MLKQALQYLAKYEFIEVLELFSLLINYPHFITAPRAKMPNHWLRLSTLACHLTFYYHLDYITLSVNNLSFSTMYTKQKKNQISKGFQKYHVFCKKKKKRGGNIQEQIKTTYIFHYKANKL